MNSSFRWRQLLWPASLTLLAALLHWRGAAYLYGMAGSAWVGEIDLIEDLLGVVMWLSGAWLASRAISQVIHRSARRKLRPVPRLLDQIVATLLFVAAGFVALSSVLEKDITGLLATSGVVVAVMGFALRNIIADIFSGIALSMEAPYHLGDWIAVDGVQGRVIEISWRATRLITREETTIVVPNSQLATQRFLNYSIPQRFFRSQMVITLDFDVPTDRAKRVLTNAVLGTPSILRTPAPDIRIDGFEERGIRYNVRFWVPGFESEADCRDDVGAAIHQHLHLAGIDVPHGRQDIAIRLKRPKGPERPEMRKARVLRAVPLLAPLVDGEITRLADSAPIRHVKAGDMIVNQGDAGDSLFVLVEGLLQVHMQDGGMLGYLRPGDLFGEMSLLTGAPRSATVIAETDSVIYEVTRDNLRPILEESPDLAANLSATLEQRQKLNRGMIESRNQRDNAASTSVTTGTLQRIRDFFGLRR